MKKGEVFLLLALLMNGCTVRYSQPYEGTGNIEKDRAECEEIAESWEFSDEEEDMALGGARGSVWGGLSAPTSGAQMGAQMGAGLTAMAIEAMIDMSAYESDMVDKIFDECMKSRGYTAIHEADQNPTRSNSAKDESLEPKGFGGTK